jgi:hypothetical protein
VQSSQLQREGAATDGWMDGWVDDRPTKEVKRLPANTALLIFMASSRLNGCTTHSTLEPALLRRKVALVHSLQHRTAVALVGWVGQG